MILQLKVKPSSKQEGVTLDGDIVVVKVKERPVEGKANKAVIALLAKKLKIAKSCIEIISGKGSKLKRVKIDCADEDEIMMKLKEA